MRGLALATLFLGLCLLKPESQRRATMSVPWIAPDNFALSQRVGTIRVGL